MAPSVHPIPESIATHERAWLDARREAAGVEAGDGSPGPVGLAMSGGGIRSATVCLGLVRELAQMKVMPWVDYLSTVSGGGYLGGSLMAALSDRTGADDQDAWTFLDDDRVRHHREHGYFLENLPGRRDGIFPLLAHWLTGGVLSAVLLALAYLTVYHAWLSLERLAGIGGGSGWHGLLLPAAAGAVFMAAMVVKAASARRDWPRLATRQALDIRVAQITRWALIIAAASLLLSVPDFAIGFGLPATVSGASRTLASTGLFLVAFGVACFLIDPDRYSVHHFYRDRLSQAYIVDRALRSRDALELSRLPGGHLGEDRVDPRSPYPIINATLNLPSDPGDDLPPYRATLTEFTPRGWGGPHTGWVEFANDDVKKTLRLATCVAVSGAALSPALGRKSKPWARVLFTLLNVRLHRWLYNPFEGERRFRDLIWRLPGTLLFSELLDRGDRRSARINVSDGGHLENLGLLALLERRCGTIIACESPTSPTGAFGELRRLRVRAKEILGLDITVELDTRRIEAGRSRHAWGRILCGPAEDRHTVRLLYLCTGRSEDDPDVVRWYANSNERFPRDSTMDQFFGEDQFDAYDRLGREMAREAFGGGAERGPCHWGRRGAAHA